MAPPSALALSGARQDISTKAARAACDDPGVGRASLRLLAAHLAAHLAEQGLYAALALHAVAALGAGYAQSAALQAAQALPLLLLSLPLGVLADRRSRTRLVVRAEIARVALYAALGWLALHPALLGPQGKLITLGVACLAVACLSTGYSVGLGASVPSLVSTPGQLARLNSRLAAMQTLGFALGPMVFGALLARHGLAGIGLAATLLSSLEAVLLIGFFARSRAAHANRDESSGAPSTMLAASALTMPTSPPPPGMRTLVREVRAGLSFVGEVRMLRDLLGAQAVFSIGFFCLVSVLAPHATHRLGLDAASAGRLVSALGVGMFAGCLLTPALLKRASAAHVVISSAWTCAIGAACVAASHFVPQAWLAGVGLGLMGMGGMCWTVVTTTLRHVATPAGLQGRVAAVHFLTLGVRVLGAVLGGLLGALFGAASALATGAGLVMLYAVMATLSGAISNAQVDSADARRR